MAVLTVALAVVLGAVAGVVYGYTSRGPWELVGSDNFSSNSLDNRWGSYDGASTNPTLSRSKQNLSVADGELRVATVGQLGAGLCWCRDKPVQRYGRWEVRARMDPGADHGAAILMWPTSENWPADGEIDIAEMGRENRDRTTFSLHYTAQNKKVQQASTGDYTQWHTYLLEWEPSHITFWIDGVQQFTTTDKAEIPTTDMFFAMQAGPDSANAPDLTSTLHVDWVKVFKRR